MFGTQIHVTDRYICPNTSSRFPAHSGGHVLQHPTTATQDPCICARCTVLAKDVEGTATPAGARLQRQWSRNRRKKSSRNGWRSMRVSFMEGMATKAADAIGLACDLSKAAWASSSAGKIVCRRKAESTSQVAFFCQPRLGCAGSTSSSSSSSSWGDSATKSSYEGTTNPTPAGLSTLLRTDWMLGVASPASKWQWNWWRLMEPVNGASSSCRPNWPNGLRGGVVRGQSRSHTCPQPKICPCCSTIKQQAPCWLKITHGCDLVEENVVFARFGLKLCQRVLGTAHWNTQNNAALEVWLKKNFLSPHDCGGIFTPGGILQSMATSGIDPTLIPDDCFALVQCDPRLVPQMGG